MESRKRYKSTTGCLRILVIYIIVEDAKLMNKLSLTGIAWSFSDLDHFSFAKRLK